MKATGRISSILAVGALFCTVLAAQRNSAVPQPQAGALPPVAAATPSRGALVDKPTGVMPSAPAGFTVSVYAELQAPRMMVYAPNGDLFVSSPSANSITMFRDVNSDGVFESRSVYAQGEVGARGGGRRTGGPRRGGAGAGGTPTPAPQPAINPTVNGPILGTSAPACAAPPVFNNQAATGSGRSA